MALASRVFAVRFPGAVCFPVRIANQQMAAQMRDRIHAHEVP